MINEGQSGSPDDWIMVGISFGPIGLIYGIEDNIFILYPIHWFSSSYFR